MSIDYKKLQSYSHEILCCFVSSIQASLVQVTCSLEFSQGGDHGVQSPLAPLHDPHYHISHSSFLYPLSFMYSSMLSSHFIDYNLTLPTPFLLTDLYPFFPNVQTISVCCISPPPPLQISFLLPYWPYQISCIHFHSSCHVLCRHHSYLSDT